MIAVDTDVLAIHHVFRWDRRFKANERFLDAVWGKVCTMIHNLLELCGLYAVAGLAADVRGVLDSYLKARDITVVFPEYKADWGDYVSGLISYVERGLSYGDALVAGAVERSPAEAFVTWNKRHFEGKLKVDVLTPDEFLTSIRRGSRSFKLFCLSQRARYGHGADESVRYFQQLRGNSIPVALCSHLTRLQAFLARSTNPIVSEPSKASQRTLR